MPKLLFLPPRFGLKSEVWMYRQATRMSNLDTVVITLEYANSETYPPDGIQVQSFPKDKVSSKNPVSRAVNLVRNLFSPHLDPNPGNRLDTRNPALISWLSEQISAAKPDVALCHYGTSLIQHSSLLKKLEIPHVVHFNGFDLSKAVLDKRYVRRLTGALQHVSGCIAVAEYMKEWLLKNGVPEEKIFHIPYGVPVHEFEPNTKLAEDPCRFVCIGRLTPKKAPLNSIRAFAKCVQKFPQSKLTLLGDGEMRSECEALVAELGVQQSVEFLGAQPMSKVQSELSQSSVFVQHSITPESGDKEGWPVAVAEAAATGLPILSTYHASIPEQVVDGKSGILVQEGDWEGMADAMIRMAGDSGLRVKMGAESRKHISQWELANQIQRLESTLIQIANQASA